MVVGKLSVNLTGFTRESGSIFGNELVRSIGDLLPFSQAIPLSVEYLNTTQLQPRKDNSTGRLTKLRGFFFFFFLRFLYSDLFILYIYAG